MWEQPRTRGESVAVRPPSIGRSRNNPAYAGKGLVLVHSPRHPEQPRTCGESTVTLSHVPAHSEQPRVRGEYYLGIWSNRTNPGTTPRTRGKGVLGVSECPQPRNNPAHAGKARRISRHTAHDRNNPAHAGKSTPPIRLTTWPKEQPRTCGEK